MKIYMQKIGMIREDVNPKNTNLNLNIDWSVEYTHADPRNINFDIVLKSIENFNLSVKITGIVGLNSNEEFIQYEVSQIIFERACNILMDMISITRESTHILSNSEDSLGFGSEHIPNTLFN